MRKTKLWTIATILLALACAMASSRFNSDAQTQHGTAQDPLLEEIATHRQWKRVNKDTLVVMVPINGGSQRDLSGFG